jgi:3-oxoadipate enol-lactonase
LASASVEMNYCPVPGGRLYYTKTGSGPTLLFIHGFCLDNRMWEKQIIYFSEWYTCISVDLRGFGKSSLPAENSYSNHEDLYSLLEFLQIREPVTLIGLSMGARAATNFALIYPHLTKALVLVDGAIDGFKFTDFDLGYIYKAGKEQGTAIANRLWLDHPLFESAGRNAVVQQKLSDMVTSYSGWHWTNKNPATTVIPPAIEQLQKLTMPVLILIGQFDIPDFKAIADFAHDQIKQSVKIEIPGAGHMSNMESPEIVNEAIRQFLTRIPLTLST